MRVEKPSGTVLSTQLQASERTEETLLTDDDVPRARAGTERGWTIEKTIVGPPPPAESPRPPAPAPPVVVPPRLVGLPPIRPLQKPVTGIVPPPIVPAPRAPASSRTSARTTAARPTAETASLASGAAATPARKPAALIVEDSGGVISSAPAPRPRAASQRVPAARTTGAQSMFPRSAAQRAGADMPAHAAPAIGRPAQLAQGSVTAPLPLVTDAAAPARLPSPPLAGPEATPSARRRPPTVEFPTLEPDELAAATAEESDQTFRDLPVASPIASVPAHRPLPSIYSVVDRRHAPPQQEPPAALVVTVHPSSSSGAFARHSHLDAEAVPEPIAPETLPMVRPELQLVEEPLRPPAQIARSRPRRAEAPAPAAAPAPRHAARPARSRSGARPAVSFSAAEAAFFAEGEQQARAEWDAAVDDLEHVSLKRPGLWRRLTRRRSG